MGQALSPANLFGVARALHNAASKHAAKPWRFSGSSIQGGVAEMSRGRCGAEPSEVVCQEKFYESLLKPATVFHPIVVTDARLLPISELRRRIEFI